MVKTSGAATKKETKQNVELARLQRWNAWIAGLFLVVGLSSLLLLSHKTLPVYIGYMTPDVVASEIAGTSVWGVASRHLFDVRIAQLLAVICFITATGYALLATIYRKQYEADLKLRRNKIRWIEHSLSGGLSIVAIAMLVGIIELPVLSLLLVLTILMHLAAFWTELQQRGKSMASIVALVSGGIAGTVSWLVIGGALVATTVFGSGAVAGFVYWLCATMAVMFILFAVAVCRNTISTGEQDYLQIERRYIVLGVIAKLLLVVQIFRGVM